MIATTPEELDAWRADSHAYTKEVAINPATDPAILCGLSHGPYAAFVAANPNTPSDVIWQLAERYPAEVCQNPVLPLLFLEDPNLLIHPFTLELLARCSECPDYLQGRFQAMDQRAFGVLLNSWHDRVFGKKDARFYGERAVYGVIGTACHDETFGTRHFAWRAQIVTGLESPARFLKRLSGYRRDDKTDGYRDGMFIGADRVLEVLRRMGCVQYTLFNMWEGK